MITKRIPGALLVFGGIGATLGWTFDNPTFVSISIGLGAFALSVFYILRQN